MDSLGYDIQRYLEDCMDEFADITAEAFMEGDIDEEDLDNLDYLIEVAMGPASYPGSEWELEVTAYTDQSNLDGRPLSDGEVVSKTDNFTLRGPFDYAGIIETIQNDVETPGPWDASIIAGYRQDGDYMTSKAS